MRSFTIYDIYRRNAGVSGEAVALVENKRRVTFENLLKQVDWTASGFSRQGIGKGDRIAILSNNHYRFFVVFGAAAALGAIVVPVNWRLSNDEIEYILKDCDPRAIIVDAAFAGNIQDMMAGSLRHVKQIYIDATAGKAPCLDDLMISEPFSPAPVEGDDPFCIIYTAAVDGKPRGAVLSHANVIYGNLQTSATMELTRRDAYVNMLPLFHITGLNLSFSVMHMGGKNVIIPKFDEKMTLEQTQKEKITVWGSFPPILSRLTEQMKAGSYDVSSLRHVLGLDGPDTIRTFEEKTHAVFWMLYGQTETSGMVTFSPALEKPGSAGQVGLLTKMRLVDEQDQDVPAGQAGEIVVQGPLVFKGFWRQDAVNERTFRNGWHHTGDMGQLDADGYLWFKGRKPEKELIKPGGENVYPAEVEAVVLQHSDVAEVSVIGVPDPQFGEGIKAVCVLKPGASLGAKELIEFVASRIARYKKPRYVDFADQLPKKADGSIDREKVKQLYGK